MGAQPKFKPPHYPRAAPVARRRVICY